MKQLLRLISIDKVSMDELALIFGTIAENVIQLLKDNHIGKIDDKYITFARNDRLKLALLALKEGIDIKDVAKVLSWRDFEYFASIILKEHNYQVYHSIRINRLEIDILAIDDFALAVDCKHWKYNSYSMLNNAIKKQIERSKLLLNDKRFNIKSVIPIILTLHESITFIDNVPIIPIEKFDNFLKEFKGYLDTILTISL